MTMMAEVVIGVTARVSGLGVRTVDFASKYRDSEVRLGLRVRRTEMLYIVLRVFGNVEDCRLLRREGGGEGEDYQK